MELTGALRRFFVFLSEQQALRRWVTRNGWANRAARRFVAGETLEEACDAAARLNAQGKAVTLNLLGERTTRPEDAQAAAVLYRKVLEEIHRRSLHADLAVKLTQLGLDLSPKLAEENLDGICTQARRLGGFVWIDMEASRYVEATLEVYRNLRASGHGPDTVGVALQAYLYRSERDLEDLLRLGTRIRLVKGAYAEPPHIAYPRKADVDRAYVRLLERLLRQGYRPAIATHDERILAHARSFAEAHGIPLDRFEFQMLYGVRRDLQARVVQEGGRLRVYVPFGPDWYPYFMRRLGERPANAAFLLRSLVQESPGGFGRPSGVE
ncbi:MAG: proline dehydrogenase family protein [Armatimonadetes bacterium]|nr:proline dehydrogenase family protein [Armatimonadota bacterium]MDW8154846.1 proline dehydrogenase family protein [Armatimonadota bacterium]